jgi:hypothetical protein
MKYLILDGFLSSGPHPFPYRGMHRKEPPYCRSQSSDHRINLLWLWYAEETYELGGVRDRTIALRFVDLCNEHFSDMHFEVIGVTEENEAENDGDRFMGFDVTWPASVALPEVLKRETEAVEPIDMLDELLRRYLAPKLNEFGLFGALEDASRCCHSIMAIEFFHPDYYDCGNHEYRVVECT